MSNVINLNAIRKKKARVAKKAQASENTVKFGRTKAEKKLEEAKVEKLHRHHDGHQIDD